MSCQISAMASQITGYSIVCSTAADWGRGVSDIQFLTLFSALIHFCVIGSQGAYHPSLKEWRLIFIMGSYTQEDFFRLKQYLECMSKSIGTGTIGSFQSSVHNVFSKTRRVIRVNWQAVRHLWSSLYLNWKRHKTKTVLLYMVTNAGIGIS